MRNTRCHDIDGRGGRGEMDMSGVNRGCWERLDCYWALILITEERDGLGRPLEWSKR